MQHTDAQTAYQLAKTDLNKCVTAHYRASKVAKAAQRPYEVAIKRYAEAQAIYDTMMAKRSVSQDDYNMALFGRDAAMAQRTDAQRTYERAVENLWAVEVTLRAANVAYSAAYNAAYNGS